MHIKPRKNYNYIISQTKSKVYHMCIYKIVVPNIYTEKCAIYKSNVLHQNFFLIPPKIRLLHKPIRSYQSFQHPQNIFSFPFDYIAANIRKLFYSYFVQLLVNK